MKKAEKAGKDLANFRLRMREEQRAGIEAAAAPIQKENKFKLTYYPIDTPRNRWHVSK